MKFFKNRVLYMLKVMEQYTKTDMRYLTTGGFWLGLGHGVQVLSGLVLAIAFANLLPKDAYGIYQSIIAGAAIASAFTLSGMHIAVKQASAKGIEGALRYGFRTQMLWNTGIVIVSGGTAIYYLANENTTLAASFAIIAICAPLIEGFRLYRSYLVGIQKFRESTLFGLWRRPFFIITLLTALFFTDNVIILIAVYFASNAISAGFLYFFTIKKYRLTYQPNTELKQYSKHLSVMEIVGVIGDNIDKILIFHFLGAIPVAIYTLAMLPISHLQNLVSVLGELVFPKVAKQHFHILQQTLTRKVGILTLIVILGVISYVLAAPYIYPAIFPAYPEAILLSQLLAVSLLVKPSTLYGQVFTAHRMIEIKYFLKISTAILATALYLILIPLYGLEGVAWGFIITRIYWAIATTAIFYMKKTPHSSNISNTL